MQPKVRGAGQSYHGGCWAVDGSFYVRASCKGGIWADHKHDNHGFRTWRNCRQVKCMTREQAEAVITMAEELRAELDTPIPEDAP